MIAASAPATDWTQHQRSLYKDRYSSFRQLHDFLRYDARYRVWRMEELFRSFDIPFERQRVFELGFGTGSLLLRFDSTSCLHGCEISESALKAFRADRRCAAYREVALTSCAEDGTVRFPDRNYDVVIASHVLEHVIDDAQTLRLMSEHTRSQGYGLFFLPLERPRHNPDHARTYTAAGFKRLLAATGWQPLHVEENFRFGSHIVQVVNWPSRARVPLLGPLVEAAKSLTLAAFPTELALLLDEPLAKLRVAPYQLMVLAQRAT